MAENLVENKVCENCGADVRLNALFCYNCGSQVASDEEVAAENQNGNRVSDAWFKETIADAAVAESATVKKKTAKPEVKEMKVAEPIPKPSETLLNETSAREVIETKPLKTASSLRNRPKPTQRKKVEVAWESPESAPNIWFLIVSLILVIFAVSILFAMLYIR